jgi:hypothetical protein
MRLRYFALSEVKSLILKLVECEAPIGLLVEDYYLYTPSELTWLVKLGYQIVPHRFPHIFDMDASFEEIFELLKFIRTDQPFKFGESMLTECFRRNVNVDEKKRLLEWWLKDTSEYDITGSILWASYQLHGTDFTEWVYEKISEYTELKSVDGNLVLRSLERGTNLTESRTMDDDHKARMTRLKRQIIEFFDWVLAKNVISDDSSLILNFYSDQSSYTIHSLSVALENTHDADFIIKCITEYHAYCNREFIRFLLDKKFEVVDSQFKCLNARKDIIPVLKCIKQQDEHFDIKKYNFGDIAFRVNLEQELRWNGFLEKDSKDPFE